MRDKGVKIYSIDSIIQEYSDLDISGVFVPETGEDIKDNFALFPHGIDAYVISLVLKGRAKVNINLQEYDLKEGMLLVMLPNMIVVPHNFSDDLQIQTIVFTYDFVSSLPIVNDFVKERQFNGVPAIPLTGSDLNVIKQLFQLIAICYHDEVNPKDLSVIEHLLYALILRIQQHTTRTAVNISVNKTRGEIITAEFFSLLYKHYKKEKSVLFYAEQLNISTKYLTTMIRQHTGYSILHWIHEVVILYAKSLLRASSIPINEISEELGFNETTLFCRYFKRYTDMTPNQYRRLKIQ